MGALRHAPALAAISLALALWVPNTIQHVLTPEGPVSAYAYVATLVLLGHAAASASSGRAPTKVREKVSHIPQLTVFLRPLPGALAFACAQGFVAQPMWLVGITVGYGSLLSEIIFSGIFSFCAAIPLFLLAASSQSVTPSPETSDSYQMPLPWDLISCGTLIWNLFTRVVPTRESTSSLTYLALFFVLLALVSLARVLNEKRRKPDSEDGKDMQPDKRRLPDELLALGLTERESQVVLHLLMGKTSHETAELLEIKSSTVREYLRRAYRKIGVKDSSELRTRYGSLSVSEAPIDIALLSETSVPAPNGSTAENSTMQGLPFFTEVALLVASLSLLLPVGAPHGQWGIGQAHIYALGGGILAASLSSRPLRQPLAHRYPTAGNRNAARCLLLLVCWVRAASPSIPHSDVLSFVCDTVIGALLCRWWSTAFLEWRHRRPRASSIVWSGGLLSLLALLPQNIVALSSAAALSVLILRMPSQSSPAETHGHVAHGPQGTSLIFGAITGCALEEIWRGLHWFSFMPAALTFFVLLSAFGILALSSGGLRPKTWLLVFPVYFSIVLLVSGSDAPTLLAGFSLLLLAENSTAVLRGNNSLFFIFGLACGLIFSCIAFNVIGSIFTYHVDILGIYGTQTGFELLTVFLSALLFSGLGIYFGRRLILLSQEELVESVHKELSDNNLLAREYLLAYDLTPLQIDVAMLLLQGKTVAQISGELHYAASTVGAARRACLKRLRVTSTEELRKEILAGIRCSQEENPH